MIDVNLTILIMCCLHCPRKFCAPNDSHTFMCGLKNRVHVVLVFNFYTLTDQHASSPYCSLCISLLYLQGEFPNNQEPLQLVINLFIPFIPMALMFDSGVVISGEIRHFSHLRVNRFIHGDVMWPYNYRISNFLDIKSITDCTLTKTKNVLPTKFSAKVANF